MSGGKGEETGREEEGWRGGAEAAEGRDGRGRGRVFDGRREGGEGSGVCLQRAGRPLGSRPEGGARRRVHVEREVEDELSDRVVEVLFELEPCPHYTLLESDGSVYKVGLDALEGGLPHSGLPLKRGEEVGLGGGK